MHIEDEVWPNSLLMQTWSNLDKTKYVLDDREDFKKGKA